jgi:hypothetical protein
MNAQMVLKGLAIACLALSWYFTLQLLGTYLDAVTGQLNGAGAAQWQFAFLTAPLPCLLGILALVITRFSRRLLPPRWTVLSIISALAPALLFVLVFFHVY